MARLQKFSGTQALPGVASPQVVADRAVGAATAELGPQIARSFADLGELTEAALTHEAKEKNLAERKRHAARASDLTRRKNAFAGKKAAEALELEIRERLSEPRNQPIEKPVPLADEMVTFMQLNGDKIWNELPEAQRPSFDAATEFGEDQLRTEIAVAENREDERYFLEGLSNTKDLAIETVSRLPDRIDQVFDHFVDLADTAALSERLKEQFIRDVGRELLEAWVQAHPLETQIAELSKLYARMPSGAVSDSIRAVASGSGKEQQTAFAARAVSLPDVSRNRLLAAALKQRAETTLAEQARIAERIDSAHEQVDPLEITGNAMLGNQARLQLLNRLREAVDTHSRNVSSLERLVEADEGVSLVTDDQGFASGAISYLSGGKTDPATLMRGISVSKASPSKHAGKTLLKGLASEDSEDVVQAFTTLSVLNPGLEKGGLDGAEGAQIRMLEAGKTYLAAEHGLSTEAVSALFATANKMTTRKERLEGFAAREPGKRGGKTTVFPLLG